MNEIKGEWTETIICPVCDAEQIATIQKTPEMPWPSYIHKCEACGYTITESEWEESEAKQ